MRAKEVVEEIEKCAMLMGADRGAKYHHPEAVAIGFLIGRFRTGPRDSEAKRIQKALEKIRGMKRGAGE